MGWFERSVVLSNHKIPISDFLRHQLTQPQSRMVYWSYHADERVAAVSDYSLETPDNDVYRSAGRSLLTDNNRYIRPTQELPGDFQSYFGYKTQYAVEKLAEETGLSKEEIEGISGLRGKGSELEERLDELVEEVPGMIVYFYSSESMLRELPNVAFLFSEDQFSGSFDHSAIGVDGSSTSVIRINDAETLGEGGRQMMELAEELEDEFLHEFR